ncbi:hypothetical protein F5Y04DRAFT_287974 [Hypomontagnella monticulosa]|nr:hypothetical protein F5Y04DRAFT_287974 [Hypomontagnella monticulosa]
MISTRNLPEGAIDGRQAVARAPIGHIVPKPIPDSHTQDPRKYQLNQMKRRFSPIQNTLQDGTTNLLFQLKPSDPDFPFELDYLRCELQVPASYPERPPILRVKNKDIPRGFAVNIEKGWDRLVHEGQASTLLALTNALDKNLEAFLSERKTETVTLLSFKDTRHLDSSATALGETSAPPVQAPPKSAPAVRKPYVPEESYTDEQIATARARRAQEIRQLEARMSRMPYYQKSADGVVYTLPLEPRRRAELPTELQQIHSVQLIIPLLYPLQSLKLLLNDVESADAEALEDLFAERAAQQKQMSLTSHLNYLTQNIHVLARHAEASRKRIVTAPDPVTGASDNTTQQGIDSNEVGRDGKGHIHVIPRPPEWTYGYDNGDSDDSDSDYWDSEDESDDGGVAVDIGNAPGSGTEHQAEKGTAMSFPSVELYGIELLQVSILNLSVKCERCRTLNDITGLSPGVEKASSCKKCATAFTARFRQEMVHQNSARAGFIDVACCTVADMLPSTFIPTCSRCSTPSQGLISVRGEAITNVCRECHQKFTFKIPEIKFLAISHNTLPPPSSAPRKRNTEKLGLHAGDPLPGRGACAHYRRSYRWFRFSCCARVHACDRCHDDAEDHVHEWANRMLCGWCSREQNYAVEACAFCGRSVIGKRGKGFWEGGKGTRDKTRMSRKDKRKFRRVGGSEAAKKRE